METKICSKCTNDKPLGDYHFNSYSLDGYHSNCKVCKNLYKKNYNKLNKTKRSIYRKNNKHISIWRSVLKDSVKRLNKKKEGKTIDLLGYSPIELKAHLISLFTDGMNWDNHGEWHIDHIKDVSTFDIETPPNIVNALSNLRPLWATTREINGIIYEGNLNRNKNRRLL